MLFHFLCLGETPGSQLNPVPIPEAEPNETAEPEGRAEPEVEAEPEGEPEPEGRDSSNWPYRNDSELDEHPAFAEPEPNWEIAKPLWGVGWQVSSPYSIKSVINEQSANGALTNAKGFIKRISSKLPTELLVAFIINTVL